MWVTYFLGVCILVPVHNAFNFVLQFRWRSFSCLPEFLMLFVWFPFLSSYIVLTVAVG
ncbi:hypothetical protein HanPI659440_Chr04g0169561 [Helianthus annuus]|nr:hypothetical protein HanPI659440_Chr04g0169561 [Helianthus annuus]